VAVFFDQTVAQCEKGGFVSDVDILAIESEILV